MIKQSGSRNFLSRLVLMSQLLEKKIKIRDGEITISIFPIFLPELRNSTNFLSRRKKENGQREKRKKR
ncbi:hypothetical protein CKN99_02475 [Carnobacterium maltaromaticum]|nr:hypothetical protein CKN98_02475 [Carnobacterium maltaromaticum]TFJ38356.1 hypothetical protein CKN88_02475 [Carnobacterium maltaromaticum]TFJ40891.1 hypothetical protein CKN99_02475 [Carnobacterium maltaromaticum]TFJ49199.1 hypothetical protein CKN92_01910 [Carnobacterium maltaromaticum]